MAVFLINKDFCATMFAKNIQKPRVSTSGFAVFIRFDFHFHSYSHFTLCYTSRQCYTIIHHVYIYEFSRRISENPQSETRPHSCPDRFNHLDFARNSFELCPTNTAKNHISKNQGWLPRRVAPRHGISPRES